MCTAPAGAPKLIPGTGEQCLQATVTVATVRPLDGARAASGTTDEGTSPAR